MAFGLLSINSMMKSYSRSRYSGSHARVTKIDNVRLHMLEDQTYPEYQRKKQEFAELLSERLNVNPDAGSQQQQRRGDAEQENIEEEQQTETKPVPALPELGTGFCYVPVTYKDGKS